MPELPDVEIFRRYLSETSLHKTIEKVNVLAEDILDDVSAKTVKQ